jgi:predicted nucleic acid-binding protein
MGKGYLVDTNAIIDFCNGKLPSSGRDLMLNLKPEISIITNIELFATPTLSEQELALLKKFTSISQIHPVTLDLAQITIKIKQAKTIKLPDAIIAATAISHGLTLISRNKKDFRNIEGLTAIDPYGD